MEYIEQGDPPNSAVPSIMLVSPPLDLQLRAVLYYPGTYDYLSRQVRLIEHLDDVDVAVAEPRLSSSGRPSRPFRKALTAVGTRSS